MCKIVRSIFYITSYIQACLAIYQAILYTEKSYAEFSNAKFGNILQTMKLEFGLFVHNQLLCLPYAVCKNSELTVTYILNAHFDTSLQYSNTNNTTFTVARIKYGHQCVMSEGTHLSS
jgi:hypothetical protein